MSQDVSFSSPSQSLSYATPQPRRRWQRAILALASLQAAYVLTYIVLRFCGLYYAYFSMGSWQITGGTNIAIIDYAFFPAVVAESIFHKFVRLLPMPTGL